MVITKSNAHNNDEFCTHGVSTGIVYMNILHVSLYVPVICHSHIPFQLLWLWWWAHFNPDWCSPTSYRFSENSTSTSIHHWKINPTSDWLIFWEFYHSHSTWFYRQTTSRFSFSTLNPTLCFTWFRVPTLALSSWANSLLVTLNLTYIKNQFLPTVLVASCNDLCSEFSGPTWESNLAPSRTTTALLWFIFLADFAGQFLSDTVNNMITSNPDRRKIPLTHRERKILSWTQQIEGKICLQQHVETLTSRNLDVVIS